MAANARMTIKDQFKEDEYLPVLSVASSSWMRHL